MGSDRPKVLRRFAVAGLLGLATIVPAPRVPAQEHTADPYKPYNGMYEQFVYPSYPSGYGYLPNQGVLEGRGGYSAANRLQEFLDNGDTGLLGDGTYSPRRTGPGVPYYSAGRPNSRLNDNPYQARDQEFYKDQQARQDKYMAYLREKDPKRRAQLFREYQAESQKISRDLAAPRSAFRSSGTPKPATAPTATAPAARPGTVGTNRSAPAGVGRTPGTRSTTRSLPSGTSRLNSETRTPTGRTPTPSETLRRSTGSDARSRARSRVTPSPGTPTTPAPR